MVKTIFQSPHSLSVPVSLRVDPIGLALNTSFVSPVPVHMTFVGSYSGTRPPFAGKMDEWNERWLDIRRIDLLSKIMTDRIKLAVSKGCDAVEPDNVDAYQNRNEVKKPITAADQLEYNRWIANKAHELGMSVGLKNDVGQLRGLVKYFDFAVNEQCFQYKECSAYKVFTKAGVDKAVFGVEYKGNPANFCRAANRNKLSFQKKRLSLYAWRIGCEKYRGKRLLRNMKGNRRRHRGQRKLGGKRIKQSSVGKQ